MRKIIFPAESYIIATVKDKDGKDTDKTYLKNENQFVGLLELLWIGIEQSPCRDLTKKDHRINKRLKEALRSITRFKDADEDARVANEGEQILVIEEDEYDLMQKLINAFNFVPKISDQVSDLWDIIEKAESFSPPKLLPTEKDDGSRIKAVE